MICRTAGATEDGVVDAVNSKVSNFAGWRATLPIPYNLDGQLVYVVPVLNQAGIYQKLAITNASADTIALGDTKLDVLRSFRQAMSSNPNVVVPSETADLHTITVLLTRVTDEVKDGETIRHLYSAEFPTKVFRGTSRVSAELMLAQPGEIVTLTFLDTPEGAVTLHGFDLVSLEIEKSPAQAVLEQRYADQEADQRRAKEVREILVKLYHLSDEELIQLLGSGNVLEKLREGK